MANYILDIIAWTDMSAYKWIYECVMLTSSPVFMHEVVRAEIGPLVETFEKIIRCKYPQQFFDYYWSLEEVGKLKRSRFSLLLSIARIVKEKTSSPTSFQFIIPVTGDQLMIATELAQYHIKIVKTRPLESEMPAVVKLVTGKYPPGYLRRQT